MFRKLLVAGFSVFAAGVAQSAVLGIYEFTGPGADSSRNAVTGQPANAMFSTYNRAGALTAGTSVANKFHSESYTTSGTADLTQYTEYTLTANSGFQLNLTQLTFKVTPDSPKGPTSVTV